MLVEKECCCINGEVEVVLFVVKPSSELSIASAGITIQVRGGGCNGLFLLFQVHEDR